MEHHLSAFPREELLVQAARTVRAQTSLTPGIVWRSYQQWDRPVRVIAHGSRLNREQLPTEARRPDILVLDEAHHASAPSWRHGINVLQPRWLIGFTATPFRTDKEPLAPEPFVKVAHTITPQELIDAGKLAPPVIESPAVSDARPTCPISTCKPSATPLPKAAARSSCSFPAPPAPPRRKSATGRKSCSVSRAYPPG